MKVKCKYCDTFIEDTEANCPNCGAPVDAAVRFADRQPKTIEELRNWYQAMKLPPEHVTRFFIGRDIKEPRAFGIYKDDEGAFVVYKNKADGSRAVHYRGTDEAYAVNEIYQRLKEEIVNQKNHNADRRLQQARSAEQSYAGGQPRRKKKRSSLSVMVIGIMFFIMGNALSLMMLMMSGVRSERSSSYQPRLSDGYYSYDGSDYYLQGSDWYYYDAGDDDWGHTVAEQIPDAVVNDYDGVYRTFDHEGLPFEETFWYHEPSTYSSYDNDYDSYDSYDSYDWDDDYGWDSDDSWDSYDTDWDSDW